MAVTVTDRRFTVNVADSTTGWNSDQGLTVTVGSAQPDPIEGNGRLGTQVSRTRGNNYFTSGTAVDGDTSTTGADQESSTAKTFNGSLVYGWIFPRGDPLTTTNGGLGLTIGDGTNRRSYYIAGSDLKGFSYDERSPYFQCLVLDTSQLPANFNQDSGGAINLSSLTNFGYWADNGNLKSVGGVENYFFDVIRAGNHGLRVAGGLTGDRGTFAQIAASDNTLTNAYGIIRPYSTGVFGLQGPLTFGSTSASTFFEDSGFTIAFEDRLVGNDKYFIDVEGASGQTNLFSLNGGSILSAGPAISIDFNGGNITTLSITNMTFTSTLGPITWSNQADATGHTSSDNTFTEVGTTTVLSISNFNVNSVTQTRCSFTDCGQIVATGSGDLVDCTVTRTSDTTSMVLVNPNTASITGTSFVGEATNKHAVEWNTVPTSTINWDNTQDSNFATGSVGTNVTATSNGDETIYINPSSANSDTVTIQMLSGGSVPSIRKGANYTGQVNILGVAKTIDVNVKDEDGNPVSGAFVWINDGTTTLFNGTTDVNGDITTVSYGGTNNSTLRVRLFGKEPFETTLGTATGSVSQLVSLIFDPQQQAVPTLNNTWTIDTTAQTITMTSGPTLPFSAYSAIDTSQDLYEFVMNTFAATNFMQFPVPLASVTRTQYNFINGYTFGAKDNDHKFLYGGSFTDSANNLLWSNVKSIGTVETGTGIYIVQGLEAADNALTSWWPDGNIDVLVKVQDGTFIQSTDDTATAVDGAVWIFAREYGDLYDHFFIDLSAGGQNIVALSTSPDLNNTTASGTVAGYSDISLTFGSTSQDIGDGNGNQPYEVVVDCNGRPLSEVYEYLKYITSFDFSQTVDGDDGFEYRNADEANFSNVDNKQAPFGTFAGGFFFGAQGVFLQNMAASDNTNYQLIDSNGVIRFPPTTVSFTLTGLKDGTEVRVYNTADSSLVAGVETVIGGVGTDPTSGVAVTGSTNNNTFTYTYTYSSDITVFVAVVNLDFQITQLSGLVLGNESQSIPVSQVVDRTYENN